MSRANKQKILRLVALAAATAASPMPGQAQAQPARAATLPTVEVVGTTPVPGTEVPRDQIPSNVQTADDSRLRRVQSLNLPDFMASQLSSVNVNEIQGNPFQLDVNYRGFTASPLLGTPQGLSVYMDGVRVNEPFGDVVNWDLIPRAAISSITLLPGSNPLFGLNTLGGALSLQTKRGDTHPGTELELQAGSFGRVSTEFTHGRKLGENGHLFLGLGGLNEDGWRDHSPSRVRQLFAKVGQDSAQLSWDLSFTHGDNTLVGNGLLPESMLVQNRRQVYTRPDQTDNLMSMLTLNASYQMSDRQKIAMTAYTRQSRTSTLNGDLNDDFDPPGVEESGVENRTRTRQKGEGMALQSTTNTDNHQFTLGVSLDRARTRFAQTEAEGFLDPSRRVMATEEAEADALLSGKSRTASVYFSDLVALRPNLQLTLSGRYNDTKVTTRDDGRILLGLPTQLDSDGRYRKFNPAIGLTWQFTPQFTAYGGWSQGNRAPSPIELGCSDPQNACVLPNALQSDPPLKQVVSRTFETGLRGSFEPGLRWNASLFRTANQDDLLFVSSGLARGYFTNFGRTLRQGVELGLGQQTDRLNWSVSYSYLRATHDASACLVSESNSTAETSPACGGEGEIAVRRGDRLPGLPAHNLKLNADWKVTPNWTVGAQYRAYSRQYVRGNENNAHRPDGLDFNGAGRLGGYALLDLTTSWKLRRNVEVFAKATNVFNRGYASAGQLGPNGISPLDGVSAPAAWRNEQFVAPGAPRAAWIGVRLQLDG
ncbi:MAG TPA: TonB-dependent receptor [Thiobacillus sp.]|uniref:TonB-dependent receptor n=1 Tax=unclassified Acidovorax TaxID=2684926 RepID=UPI000BD4C743|nr:MULTISPECIES: TonB-dependent receptor [unclassified Acidovorax]OYY27118.1 MAG: TonB-dependent receptor [Acidovorax sp. 35-64-16]OZA68616.1 MAG: TonB-dependent receptor [Acidovorax sp. 39-64-12]HQT71040.1 TonB-dependent receptor [Thiobacillus sp.]